MLAFGNVAEVLGLSSKLQAQHSPLAVISWVEAGLPVSALDRMARLLAPGDARFKYKFVPKVTLARRKLAHKLSPNEGTRLVRVARIWAFALEVWQSQDGARDFLFRPHPMIENKRPIDVIIQSEFAAELVVDILGRLKYGTAA